MNLKRAIIIFIYIVLGTANAYSQNNSFSHKTSIEIPEVALLGLVSNHSSAINFQTGIPSEAGNSVNLLSSQQDQNLWLNYSSIIRDKNHRRKIVAYVEGKLPEGVRINVEASEASGSGRGKLGKSLGTVALSNQPSEIITDIGSCYTGNGAQNGHFLNYKMEFTDSAENYAQTASVETFINVVYTLTDLN